MLDQFKLDGDVKVEAEKDSLGSGGFVLDSDAYNMIVAVAYLSTSKGGATAINFHFKKEDGNEWKNTIYITNKNGEPFYKDKKTGEKKPLPGMSQVNSILQLMVGKSIHELETTEKVVNIYDYNAKGDVPTKVPVLTDIIGKGITLGIMKIIEDKNVKGSDGIYRPSGETREGNEIAKAFRASDKLTNAEILAGVSDHTFYDNWVDKNKGEVRNKAKGGAKNAGTAGAPKANTAPVPADDLFGN